jgi:hypothetical protein
MTVTASDLLNIPISNSAIRWAAYTSLKKFPHTSSGTRPRSAQEILDNLFRGDLAKSALIEYLKSKGVPIPWEYDKIRTDNFTSYNPHGYHFIANKSKIECNSSLYPEGKNRITAIDCDIKVTAGDGQKIWTYPLDHKFDITVQMYYDTDATGLIEKFNAVELKEIANEIKSEKDSVLDDVINSLSPQSRYGNTLIGYGWATKNDIERFRLTNKAAGLPQTWSHRNNTRTYWNCKIRDTNPFRTLHESIS